MPKHPPKPPTTRTAAPHTEIIARGVLFHQSRLLLCLTAKSPAYAYLPGGHIEFAESAPAALVRELKEETTLKVKAGHFVMASENRFRTKKLHHEVNLLFTLHLLKSPPLASREPDLRFDWVSRDSFAKLDVRPAETKAWLLRHWDTLAAGDLPAEVWLTQPRWR